MLKYLRYFFYLAYNWNLPVAWHIVKNDIRGEKKYRIDTTGTDPLKKLENKGIDISHATMYMPASYDLLEEIFNIKEIKNSRHLLDIGSGKGRILCVAASHGIPEVTGIDFSKEFCEIARENLQKIKSKGYNFKSNIILNDAFYYEIPSTIDCIFFFNPFDEIVMKVVLENIEISLAENPRNLHVVYLNPLYKKLFINNNYKQVHHIQKLKYLEAILLTKNPGSTGA